MRAVILAGVAGLWAGAATAQDSAGLPALMEALRIDDTVQIMRAEGLDYGAELAAEMVPGASAAGWSAQLSMIYDHDRMEQQIEDGLRAALDGEDIAPMLSFMASETGQEIMALEISARAALLDPATEEAATARYEVARNAETPLYQRVETLIEDSALVDFNVMGALNANLMFYRGLQEGGAIEMGEADMLADVWAQEDAVRSDSRAWLGAFLLMAYRPLEADALDAYIAFYRSEAGRTLNAALFEAYDGMYEDISYRLGRAVARQMQGQDL